MADKFGTVLVFKDGVTKSEIDAALAKLAKVIDGNYYIGGKPPVNTFNPDHGGPVWYVP